MNDTKSCTKTFTEIDFIASLGCMRRNTVIEDRKLGHIEHIAVWVPESLKRTTSSLDNRRPGAIHGSDLVLVGGC